MAQIPLSQRLENRIGTRTKKKYDDDGNRIGGGTLITREIVGAVYEDENIKLEVAENNTEQILNAINGAIAAALEEIGLRAERHAKAETPVDTGRLRNSITHAINMDEEAVYIGTNVEYAPYVEFGVHGKAGKMMLTRAASEHGEEYRNVMKKHMQSG